MPIVNFHLVADRYVDAAIGRLLTDATHFYVETLYPSVSPAPLDRVRAFVSLVQPQHWATSGVLVSDGGEPAPYFTCLALSGRPEEQLHRLMAGFTNLLVKHLGCAPGLVRGQVISIDPVHWSIGGKPASEVRINEVGLRADPPR